MIKLVLKIVLLLSFVFLQSCVKEEFLKVCYDSSSSGCVTVDSGSGGGPLKQVNFSSAANGVAESGGLAYPTIELSAQSALDITVPFQITGTANYGALNRDYQVQGIGVSFDNLTGMGTVTIPAGTTVKSIIISIDNDTMDENDENLIITLLAPTNATLGSVNVHELVIQDEDLVPEVNFSVAAQTVVETEAPFPVTVQAELNAVSGKDVTVTISTAPVTPGTMTLFIDHDLTANTILIPAGQLTGSLVFNIIGDTSIENTETLNINMQSVLNASMGSTYSHALSVTDNDTPPEVFISAPFSEGITESNTTKEILVEMTKTCGLDLDIPYVISGNASDPDDYEDSTPVAGTVTITAGSTSGKIFLDIKDDSKIELMENITVSLASPPPGGCSATLHPSDNTFTYNILDDEDRVKANFTSSFQAQSYDVSSVQVKVEISDTLDYDVDVNYAVGGTLGALQHDFASGSVTVPAGDLTATITGTLTTTAQDFEAGNITFTINTSAQAAQGTYKDHTITVYNPDFITLPQGNLSYKEIASNNVNDIQSDDDGFIYIATNGGLSYSTLDTDMSGDFVTKTTADGLPVNDVNKVFVEIDPATSATTVYAATDEGLAVSTNGVGFVPITTDTYASDNIVSNKINTVVAKDKYVVIGTDSGASVSDDGGLSWTNFTTGNSDLPHNVVNHVDIDEDLKITFCTDDGIIQRKVDGTWQTHYLSGEKCIKYTMNPTETHEYVLTNSGIRKVTELANLGVATLVDDFDGLDKTKVTDMEITSSNYIVVSGYEGVALSTDAVPSSFVADLTPIDGTAGKFKAVAIHTDPFAGDPLQDTYYLAASTNSGVSTFEDYTWGWLDYNTQTKTATGLKSQRIHDVIEDLEIVVAHDLGVSYSQYDAIEDAYNGFLSVTGITNPVYAIFHDNDSNGGGARIYYGAYAGEFGYLDANGLDYAKQTSDELDNVMSNPALSSTNITDILVSPANDIFITTETHGLMLFENDATLSFFEPASTSFGVEKNSGNGLISSNLSALFYSELMVSSPNPVDDPVLCYASIDSGAHCTSTDFDPTPGEDEIITDTTANVVNDIAVDDDGNVYFASNNEVIRKTSIAAGGFSNMFQITTAPFLDRRVNTIALTDAATGVVVAGGYEGIATTADSGVSWLTFDTKAGLPHNQINKVVIGSDGYLYVGTENGFARSRKPVADLAIP